MDTLPADVRAYARSPEFDNSTLPAALRRQHSTKPGTWALIHVLQGRLIYRIYEPREEVVLEPGRPGVIRPAQLHEVEPASEDLRMFVEFYTSPEA